MRSDYRGRYGQYIYVAVKAVDFLILNLVFWIALQINPEVVSGEHHPRILWLVLNISYLPVVYWFSRVGHRRTVYLDHVVLSAFQAVGVHFLTFLSIMAFISYAISWVVYLELYGMLAAGLLVWWVSSRLLVKRMRRNGRNSKNVVIVGNNSTARRLAEEMASDGGFGFRVRGFFDDESQESIPEMGSYLGGIDALGEYVKNNDVEAVYYTLSGSQEDSFRAAIKTADDSVIQFFYVPQVPRFMPRAFELNHIGRIPILSVRRNSLKSVVNRVVKRTFDIAFSSLVLLFSPLIFIPVAIAIKLSSPGPVFFRQKRTGYRGKDFLCWKFRTMRVNAKADQVQAQKDDPRKTKIGELLRRTSIDELPQFINVFVGDMSVVGPRPHMLKHTEDYSKLIDKYMVRHLIKPGITGWAQVNGYRGLTDQLWQMEKRVEYDVWYIENWSFLLDLKIIVKTVVNAVRGEKNAF